MSTNDIFRMALIIHPNALSTQSRYIIEYAKMVLYDQAKPMSASDILDNIKSNFGIEFTDDEVNKVLKSRKLSNPFRILENDFYELKLDEIYKIRQKITEQPTIESFTRQFIEQNETEFEQADLSSLIKRFIYYSFNSNKDVLLRLLGCMQSSSAYNLSDFNATAEERKAINDFLNWNNIEKNKFLYSVITSCFDYCMLTVKKDRDSFVDIFNGKKFFLDANVIFRLAGINSEDKSRVITSFIIKCKENKIGVCYTNFTYEEVKTLVNYKIDLISQITNNKMPIGPYYLEMIRKEKVDDFYRLYYDWCKTNSDCDLNSFKQFVMNKINSTLRPFKQEVFSNYAASNLKNRYHSWLSSLKEYKYGVGKIARDDSLSVDINNFMYVFNARKKSHSSNFWQINEYIISADSAYCSWSNTIMPGFPIVVMPSHWLSIILKFTGRTNDDYRTFCQFLNLRYSESAKPAYDPDELLAAVYRFSDDTDIQQIIVQELGECVEFYNWEDPIDYDDIVESAYKKAVDDEYAKRLQNIDEEVKTKLEGMMESHNQSADSLANEFIDNLARANVREKLKWTRLLTNNRNEWLVKILVPVILWVVLFFNHDLSQWISTIISNNPLLKDIKQLVLGSFAAAIAAVADVIVFFIFKRLSSPEREERLLEREKKHLLDLKHKVIAANAQKGQVGGT